MSALHLSVDWPRGDFSLRVSLDLPAHGITALFGHSGSGKTTLLRLIAGLDRAPARIALGDDVWQDERRFMPPHQRPVGVVFQDAALFPHLTARANIDYGRRRAPSPMNGAELKHLIELLGIGTLLDRKPVRLSGGEAQRVAIARALAVKPRVLLMDEPLAALDDARRREILPYLDRLHSELKIPLIYITHSIDEVMRLADHLVMLESGRAVWQGPLAEGLGRLDLPLAHRDTAAIVIDTAVSGHDDALQITHVSRGALAIELPGLHGAPGAPLRIRIAARDVSLALERPRQTSILNLLPARVTALVDDAPGQVLVQLALDDIVLLARITRKSAHLLGLQPGMAVVAQVKSVAVA
ncbi:MAG: molybdenum ABC transporter ATP-binding protein [Gammaproteobacteria bacterium]